MNIICLWILTKSLPVILLIFLFFQVYDVSADIQPVYVVLVSKFCYRPGRDGAGGGLCLVLLGVPETQGYSNFPTCTVVVEVF